MPNSQITAMHTSQEPKPACCTCASAVQCSRLAHRRTVVWPYQQHACAYWQHACMSAPREKGPRRGTQQLQSNGDLHTRCTVYRDTAHRTADKAQSCTSHSRPTTAQHERPFQEYSMFRAPRLSDVTARYSQWVPGQQLQSLTYKTRYGCAPTAIGL